MTRSSDISDAIGGLLDEMSATSTRFRPALLALCKSRVKEVRDQAKQAFYKNNKGTQCARSLSDFQDRLIIALHDLAVTHLYPSTNPSTSEHLSIVAVGGYGRGALAPGSDIDLLFLLPYKQTAWGESVAEFLLYVLWDLGFKVGHATRSVDECIRLSKNDATILTSVLEARLICGDGDLFSELSKRFHKEIVDGNSQGFIRDKLLERHDRHVRAGESRYLVEPNVKDSKGGLRDLHTLFWIGKFVYGAKTNADLIEAGVFSRSELKLFTDCEEFLWTVRCHLHFLTNRPDDRLSFDKQSEVAERMGFVSKGRVKHVERFMHRYFLVAKDVGDLTRIFCAVLEAEEVKTLPRVNEFFRRLTGRNRVLKKHPAFRFDSGRLAFKRPGDCKKTPIVMLQLFNLAARENLSIHPNAYKTVRRALGTIDDGLRFDKKANELFLDTLLNVDDPESSLRKLNDSGVLGRFIPDFGKIVAMMQFNMYHHFTVDEHLIRAIGILSRIEKGDQAYEHPLATDLIKTLSPSARKILFLAVLLHDIAKGRQESHSIAGERVARSLCPRLGLEPSETDTVAWLVRHHLVMSETAQSRDLNDYKTILDFTKVIQTPERLKLMLILTVVDIRAVGPGVWNGWKGQLLRTLYEESEPVVSGGHSRVSRDFRITQAKGAFRQQASGLSRKEIDHYLKLHYDPYWLTLDTQAQIKQAKMVMAAIADDRQIASNVSTDEFTAITALDILAPDHPRLLSLLTGACAKANANIAGAQIFTTTTGMALDTLLIQRELDESDELKRARRIAALMEKLLRGQERLPNILAGPGHGDTRLKSFQVEPRVVIDNDSSNVHTVIELTGRDRVGLLHDLTEALFRLNLNIASAHITTYGERAVDVFYVSDLTGSKITNKQRQNQINEGLTQALAPSAQPTTAKAG